MLHCSDCKQLLQIENFNINRSTKRGRDRRCKLCTSIAVKAWRRANPERAASHHRKRLYGISTEQFEAMYNNQAGLCGACTTQIPKYGRSVAIDHNHKTGKVRGLLCHNCNDALGKLKDSPALVKNLLDYIIKYEAGDYHFTD